MRKSQLLRPKNEGWHADVAVWNVYELHRTLDGKSSVP